MNQRRVDVVILGSGFGGSLLSLILARSGRSVAVIDRATHPRFAIGESSTPLADQTLRRLADRYEIPELRPLCSYGAWCQGYPDVVCGLKRGFSYFDQTTRSTLGLGATSGVSVTEDSLTPIGDGQLLVAASANDLVADTHWLRSDVDQLLFGLSAGYGVQQIEQARYSICHQNPGWNFSGSSGTGDFCVESDFAVDASGASRVLPEFLGIPDQTDTLRTHSSAVYAHFSDVRTVAEVLDEMNVCRSRHPFLCDAAAVHHVLDAGWMWQLRFDDDSVSAGFVMDQRQTDFNPMPPEGLWRKYLQQSSFVRSQFQESKVIRPSTGLRFSGRLQRLTTKAAGDDWAALPNTAGFIDPLHSTGIAHTLMGIERLAGVLLDSASDVTRRSQLYRYSETLIDELRLVDALVEGCYASLPVFRLWCAWCMVYFAAATSAERIQTNGWTSFLKADDRDFRETVSRARERLGWYSDLIRRGEVRQESGASAFESELKAMIQPWNAVGLLDATTSGMYSQTAAPLAE
ncbi:MAG: tryptophan 7-halogenase [Planctomycetaceae bacterium]|nr:tryptophan 7-halogenase [Planctomycetaceae bacterium]